MTILERFFLWLMVFYVSSHMYAIYIPLHNLLLNGLKAVNDSLFRYNQQVNTPTIAQNTFSFILVPFWYTR